jgi:hypothetical protein
LSLMTKVMKARHRRCSRFMHSRITSSCAEYSPLLSSLRSIFLSVSVLQKKTKATNPVFSLSLSLSFKQQGDKSLPPSVSRSNSPNRPPLKIWLISLVDESATSRTGIKSKS